MRTKKWLAFSVVICCFVMLLHPVSAVISPNEAFYVYDGAQVLSNETEQYILNTNRELESKTGAQIVVVTIPSLEGQSLEEYATDLFRQWGIGDKVKNNGLLLLCAVEDRQFRVEVGYGLEGDLPDGKTGRMQDDYIIPLLRENQFDAGIKNGYSAFLQEVANVYDVSITGETAVSYGEEEVDVAFLICLGIGMFWNFLPGALLLSKRKPRLTGVFWAVEALQLVIIAVVLKSLFSAVWILGFSLALSAGLRSNKWRSRNFNGGFGRTGGFGGGFGGSGFGGGFGGGGRSGGGGSSRGF